MRHQKKGYKLGRSKPHREATLAALSTALIKHKRIRTTLTKAKALRMYVEPLITRSKDDTTHNRRQVFRHLQDKHAVKELFDEVAAQIGDRPGGYTRIVKLGQRLGDGAEVAVIELVDYNDVQPEGGSSGSKSRTRRGGGKGRRRRKKTTAATTTTTQSVAPDDDMKGVETTTVEEPVADEVAEPVQARTEDTPEGVEEDAVTGDDVETQIVDTDEDADDETKES